MEGLSCIVKGRVQGVGYRYFTQNLANTMGLSGWVRNLPDGTVEVLGIGGKEELERFLHKLKAGPIGSHVKGVDFQWLEDQKAHSSFEIRM